jgi:hypothetical protein
VLMGLPAVGIALLTISIENGYFAERSKGWLMG